MMSIKNTSGINEFGEISSYRGVTVSFYSKEPGIIYTIVISFTRNGNFKYLNHNGK